MSKIPTAEQLLRDKYKLEGERGTLRIDQVSMFMIEFAKLHCKAQRKEILSKSFEVRTAATGEMIKIVTEDSILKAYPLTNIK